MQFYKLDFIFLILRWVLQRIRTNTGYVDMTWTYFWINRSQTALESKIIFHRVACKSKAILASKVIRWIIRSTNNDFWHISWKKLLLKCQDNFHFFGNCRFVYLLKRNYVSKDDKLLRELRVGKMYRIPISKYSVFNFFQTEHKRHFQTENTVCQNRNLIFHSVSLRCVPRSKSSRPIRYHSLLLLSLLLLFVCRLSFSRSSLPFRLPSY